MDAEAFLNFVDGGFVPAQSQATFVKVNPFTGETLGTVASSDAMDVIRAIQAAKRAQTETEKWTLQQRADLLNAIAEQLEKNQEEWSYQEALHQGLPQYFVLEKSILPAIKWFKKAAHSCEVLQNSKSTSFVAKPTGIVSILLSWNLSLRLLCERLAPALAAGNVCLVKVSELSPVTAKIFGEVLQTVKAPKGLVQFLQGRGPEVGAMMAAHPSVRAVNFVGKLSNAETIVKGALPQLKKVQVHSGAKNSCLVLETTDIKTHVPKILESFLVGQGQLCWNITRLFVLESVQQEVIDTIKETIAALKPATSPKDNSGWYPVIHEEVLAAAEKKSQQIKVEEGKLIVGGSRTNGPGLFFQPTVSLDLPNCSELQQEELRAPILIVTAVKYPHEMAKWTNTGYFAHSAMIWGPEDRAITLAEKIDAGTISLNSWLPDEFQPGHRQTSFGNLDLEPFGRFYSDVKTLTRPRT